MQFTAKFINSYFLFSYILFFLLTISTHINIYLNLKA